MDTSQSSGYIDDLTVDDGNNPQSGTNIAAAIDAAQQELESQRRRTDSLPIIVLLLDGESSKEGDPIQAASDAKAKGTRIISIGLGDSVETTLKAIASVAR